MNQETTLLQKAGVFALVCVGVLALSGVWYMYKAFSHQDTRTFTVQGKGEEEVTPNKATINADFVGEGKTADEATTKLKEMSEKVFTELEKAGVKEGDIKTQNFSTNPKYEYCYNFTAGNYPVWCKGNPSQNRIVGYEATENFSVTVKDNKEMVEKLLGLFPSLGARNTNGPSWEVDNKDATQKAREKAVKEAREKAEGIAKSLGIAWVIRCEHKQDQRCDCTRRAPSVDLSQEKEGLFGYDSNDGVHGSTNSHSSYCNTSRRSFDGI